MWRLIVVSQPPLLIFNSIYVFRSSHPIHILLQVSSHIIFHTFCCFIMFSFIFFSASSIFVGHIMKNILLGWSWIPIQYFIYIYIYIYIHIFTDLPSTSLHWQKLYTVAAGSALYVLGLRAPPSVHVSDELNSLQSGIWSCTMSFSIRPLYPPYKYTLLKTQNYIRHRIYCLQ